MKTPPTHPRRGLTLVEVILLVASVAVLVSIAIPNYIAAQIRSDVAQVKNDQRNLATAIESYYVDHQTYPPNNFGTSGGVPGMSPGSIQALIMLSTPVAYIPNSFIEDPFARKDNPSDVTPGVIAYTNSMEDDADANSAINEANISLYQKRRLFDHGFWLTSAGPDRIMRISEIAEANGGNRNDPQPGDFIQLLEELRIDLPIYDPTNGTASNGDILRTRKGRFSTTFTNGCYGL